MASSRNSVRDVALRFRVSLSPLSPIANHFPSLSLTSSLYLSNQLHLPAGLRRKTPGAGTQAFPMRVEGEILVLPSLSICLP